MPVMHKKKRFHGRKLSPILGSIAESSVQEKYAIEKENRIFLQQ